MQFKCVLRFKLNIDISNNFKNNYEIHGDDPHSLRFLAVFGVISVVDRSSG
jgi:hypothetical protein